MPNQNDTTRIVELETEDGVTFIAYAGPGGTVYLERVRPSGRRGPNSIFHFDISVLLGSIVRAIPEVVAQPRAIRGGIAA